MLEDFPSLKTMKIPVCFIIIALQACDANVNIIGGDTLYFENAEQLSITCTNNVTAIVEYKKDGFPLTVCVLSSGCTIKDAMFTVYGNVSSGGRYLLQSVNNFTTDLCGAYECEDVSHGPTDTVNVSYKDFDNNTYIAEEKADELSITTACVFPAVLDDMEITWYTYHNGYLELMSAADLDAFNRVPTNITCPNVTCGISQAHSFTFGLGNLNGSHLSEAFVEVKIVHPMFKDKPLIWRSSKQYPVVSVKQAPDDSGLDGVKRAVIGVVVGVVAVVVVGLVLVIKKKILQKRRPTETVRLFSALNDEGKSPDEQSEQVSGSIPK
ncbi:uncharacterized protein LOC128235342 [Mya arenaria]|uniref:uncharacterized protein LOC128235342 n=1 Tax=Mya arenaria TaxID=6604 RepID=UPI0022E3FBBC|nr:uncharacterized protein LOC128235342 [Mya arenaria]